MHMPIRKVKQWLRPGSRKNAKQQRFEASLERLAQREVSDTVAEADVQAWLALLEAGGAPEPESGAPQPRRGQRRGEGGGGKGGDQGRGD